MTSLFEGGKSRIPKETKDDPIHISERSRAEWTQAAIERDNERRRKEREGNKSSPINKQDLNLTVEERG